MSGFAHATTLHSNNEIRVSPKHLGSPKLPEMQYSIIWWRAGRAFASFFFNRFDALVRSEHQTQKMNAANKVFRNLGRFIVAAIAGSFVQYAQRWRRAQRTRVRMFWALTSVNTINLLLYACLRLHIGWDFTAVNAGEMMTLASCCSAVSHTPSTILCQSVSKSVSHLRNDVYSCKLVGVEMRSL